ncbi:MAG: response regulator [Firmicutes bacterium]|nr:response regulator [Bacillota bacterium]
MYLFLIDYSYISSEHLQKLIGQVLPEEDIVNCFSPATLLKISEKLSPDLVIIDFALVEEDKVGLIETLREKCPETYILALIEPDYYEHLYQAIEKSLVDDYIVKPVSEDEFAARILITTRRSKRDQPLFILPKPEKPAVSEEDELATAKPYLFDEPDQRETATPASSLFEESTVPKTTEHDFFTPHSEENYDRKTAADNLEEISLDGPDLDLPEQPDFNLVTPVKLDLPEQVDQPDDLFSESFGLLDAEEPNRSSAAEEKLEVLKTGKELGEDYFNDLFLEDNDLEEQLGKIPEPESILPDPPIFNEFDDVPERDINISIKDFMPGESADHFLREKETETTATFNEELLDRFLDDEEEEEDEEEEGYDEVDEPSGASRFLSVVMNIVLALLLLMMASLSFFLIHNRVADGPPSLAGFTFLVMQDDEPNADVNPGSLALIRSIDVTSVELGDIINFKTPVSPNTTATQRVVEINRDEGLKFVTSRNSEGVVQTTVVPAEDVMGKALISLPFYGRMVDYVQTSQGLILLIFVPGVLIIIFQLIKIIRHIAGNRRTGRRGRYREVVEEE